MVVQEPVVTLVRREQAVGLVRREQAVGPAKAAVVAGAVVVLAAIHLGQADRPQEAPEERARPQHVAGMAACVTR